MAMSIQVRASTGSALPWKYDVFLSFRGADTRKGFTDYLYKELQRQGIMTFRDDPQLERGTVISPELLTAIEQSRFAVVVLSPKYATSTWCLLELSKILDYCRYETELIRDIVHVLWSRVHPSLTVFGSSEKLVGMDTKLEEIDVLLDKEANDVRFIGIWGMGGLGKTTLARQVYEGVSHLFEVCIFLANVREVSATQGLVHLQKQILSQILKEENVQVWNVYSGITMIKRCFCNKVVLLVLDDVDQSEQLENLVGEKDWFGSRSRIIITARDRHVLVAYGVEKPYELKGLNEDEALQLFSWKAFRKYVPEEDYAELSKSFVMNAGGLPLALKTLGSFLYQRSPDAWNSALAKLRSTPNKTIFDLLKVSYDGLDEMEKKIFLDITCYSSQCRAKFIIELLYSSDVCNRIAIDVLVEKSLLTISSDNEIGIHDLIQEMGCEIVRQESYEEPGGRSRLWLRNDIFHVFTKNTGTEAIEGILLCLADLEEAYWNLEAFSKMRKLRLLYIHNLRLSLGPKYLPNALIILNWSRYPSKSLPPAFQPDELTELSLVHSNIDHLWNGIKYLSKLKSIDLSYSVNLTRTPDFTGTPNLEKLVLAGCTSLVKIHPSIALLKRLKIWNFRDCISIKSLLSEVHMEFLETFDVSGCSKLKRIPEFLGQMKRLSLSLGGSAVEKLPSSSEHLSESLVKLDLNGSVIREQPCSLFLKLQNLMVSSFGFFPRKSPHPLIPLLASLKHFSCLRELNLNDCNLCEGDIPNDIGSLSSLQKLELRGNNFVTLPSIHLLSKLYYIDVRNCKRLQQLPELPVNQQFSVRADNCTSLQVFPEPSYLCPSWFSLTGINCSSTVANQYASYFLYSALKRLIEVTPLSYYFELAIPGSEIPVWISNQSVGDSVTEKLDASNSKLIGFAVCALIVPQENPSAHRGVDPGICLISWWWKKSNRGGGLSFGLSQIVSDHLLLVVAPSIDYIEDPWPEVTFDFEIYGGNNRCMKVKKCGARALYQHDMEELISIMNQSKSSISLYEATDEQEGAMVTATTSRNGASDDEYYSAEE
uniref:TMV resistance protein N-like n=1 Tax=Fragaria vesca subsp. vesca TaxID=101020 RepID=UPI0005CAE248|nr:PREDICTED: TMV resistance protein N-like [Fragaria vesca subsp. vesca]